MYKEEKVYIYMYIWWGEMFGDWKSRDFAIYKGLIH